MDTNRFYKLNNPKDRQYINIYINLDDISSVQYPNESLNLGIVTTKTGKEHYIQKDELDKLIEFLNIINVVSDWKRSHDEKINKIYDKLFNVTEPDKRYFPGNE